MSNGKKLIRVGSRLIEVPLGDATEKKRQTAQACSSSPPVAPVAASAPSPVIVTPEAEAEAVPAPKTRRRRKPAASD